MNDADTTDATPTVYLLDPDPQTLRELTAALREAGLQVAPCASPAVLAAVCPAEPIGCLVRDARIALADDRGLPTIVTSGTASVATAVAALQNGAVDFLEKPLELPRLRERIDVAFALDVVRRRRARHRRACQARLGRLTPREREVMDMVVAGKANKVVAFELGISPKTVETHRARLMTKLEVASFADLVRLGWLALHGDPAPAYAAAQRSPCAAELAAAAAAVRATAGSSHGSI